MRKEKVRENNKGFTLVELIVVIVILGILAAMLIPALLGYIDKAKGQQVLLNAKSVYTAAQADLSAAYATNMELDHATEGYVARYGQDVLDTADVNSAKKVIVGTKAPYDKTKTDKTERHNMYTVDYIYYEEDTGAIYFQNGAWTEIPDLTKYTIPSGTSQYYILKTY